MFNDFFILLTKIRTENYVCIPNFLSFRLVTGVILNQFYTYIKMHLNPGFDVGP